MARPAKNRQDRRNAAFFYGSLTMFVLLVFLCLWLLADWQQSYVFIENGTVTNLSTYEKDPVKAMEEAGIDFGYRDSYRMYSSGRHHTVEICHAVCVSLIVDGEMSLVSTSGSCVRDVLEQVNTDYYYEDILNCELGDIIYDGMEISLTTVRHEYVSYDVPTAAGVEYVRNPASPDGEMTVIVPGRKGLDSIVFCDTYVSGVRVSREVCGRCTVAEGEKRIVEIGTGQLATPEVITPCGNKRALAEPENQEQEISAEPEHMTNWSGEGDEGDTNNT